MLIALLIFAAPVFAQPVQPNLNFQHVTVQNGLSQNAVHALVQDRRGFLWIATEDGLNRYDGYSFTIYRRQLAETVHHEYSLQDVDAHRVEHPGLSDALLHTLYEDSEGSLWIGTADGVNRYVRHSGAFRHYRPWNEELGVHTPLSARAITEDLEGRLWVGATPGGLSKLNEATGNFHTYLHDPQNPYSLSSNRISSIAVTPDGMLWVGTEDAGLNRFDPVTAQVIRFSHSPIDEAVTSGSRVSDLTVDQSGMLWITTQDAGLSLLDPGSGEVQRFRHDPNDVYSLSSDALRTVYEDSQQRLWIGHYPNGGLDLFDRGSGRFFNYTHRAGLEGTLSDNHVLSVLEDASGIVWFGTSVGGLNKYNPGQREFTHYRNEWWTTNSLSDNTVRSFHREGTLLYIGTAGGLNVLDLQSGDFTLHVHDPDRADSLPNNIVRYIARDDDGHLWLATHGGLSRFDPETQTFTNYRHDPQDPESLSVNMIWRVLVDSSGMIWAGSRGELNRLNPETGKFQRFQFDLNNPTLAIDWLLAVHEDSRGDLWFGSSRYDSDSQIFRDYAPAPGQTAPMSNAVVMSIAEDRDGVLWFGTRDGLNRLDDPEAGHFTQFTTDDGLPNNVIYGILTDDEGHLWLSTNRGMARFDPRSGEVKHFDVSHGLQADEFNNGAYFRAESGEMYFGGINGFNVFDPARIRQNEYESPLVITRFLVLNEERNIGHLYADVGSEIEELILSYQENYLSFEFAALDYSAPERIRYEYRLLGLNEEWVSAGNRRFATYTNLSPGTYRFQVRGTNSDDQWSPHMGELSFQIMPVFWQTAWFQISMILVAGFLILLLYQYNLFSIRRRNTALEALVSKRTTELQQTNESLHSEVRHRKEAEEAIRKIAYHDYLTGLPNRRLFTSLCEKSLAQAVREKKSLALMFVDVNGFKAINDQWGHEAGDAALVSVADRIRGIIRESDVACRMGGDEFVLLLHGVADRQAAGRVAEKLTAAIVAPATLKSLETGEQHTVCIGVSIGIALYPEHGLDLETLLSRADRAMYVAKERDMPYSIYQGDEL